MSEYKIITDSTSDLSQEMVDELGVDVIPMTFNIGNDSYIDYPDDRDITPHDFYTRIANGELSTTIQISPMTFSETFENYLKAGTDVLYLGFSSGLSGTYNNSVMVAKELSEKYPDRKMLTVDTRSASLGEGLLVWDTVQEQRKGASIEDLRDWAEKNSVRMYHWFTVNDLNHLKRGGRLSATAALMGTMLGIKPVLQVDGNGKLGVVDKIRGRKQALDDLVKLMEKTQVNAENQMIFISHTDYLDGAEYVRDRIAEKFATAQIRIGDMGPVIGAHTGVGTVALFYLGTEKEHD